MKSRLLITMGCSWTEGVGCYRPKINYTLDSPPSRQQIQNNVEDFYTKNEPNFRKYGWPNRLGKKLGFDKVINLGHGGASHSSSSKLLFEYFEDNNLDSYDIFIVWMMTEPSRFSFYNNGKIKNYMPSVPESSNLSKEYLLEIENITLDSLLEQKFYMKCVEDFCNSRNINILFTSWHDTYPLINKLYKTKNYLHQTPIIIRPPYTKEDDSFLKYYSFCSHPNEDGYEWIASEMANEIKNNHKNWYTRESNTIEWQWLGNPRKNEDILKPI